MQSKAAIERQIEHFKHACTGDAATNAIWIQALEWVLGDEEHRKWYELSIKAIEPPPRSVTGTSPREMILEHCLSVALERLR